MRPSLASALLLVACAGAPRRAEPQCSAEAAIVLGGQDDVADAAGCLTVASLTIRTGAALDLAPLRKLHVVLGELRVGPSVGFEELQLPELHSVGTLAVAGNGNLMHVALPKLVSARRVAIEGNIELTTIALPALARVTGDVTIADHAALGLVELSSLVTVGGRLRVVDNPELTLLELAGLERAAAVELADNDALAAEVADAVRAKAAP